MRMRTRFSVDETALFIGAKETVVVVVMRTGQSLGDAKLVLYKKLSDRALEVSWLFNMYLLR